jgi:hypothetical protein
MKYGEKFSEESLQSALLEPLKQRNNPVEMFAGPFYRLWVLVIPSLVKDQQNDLRGPLSWLTWKRCNEKDGRRATLCQGIHPLYGNVLEEPVRGHS